MDHLSPKFEKKSLKRQPQFGYRLLYWELGAVHRAASMGDVAAVSKILDCRSSSADDVDHEEQLLEGGQRGPVRAAPAPGSPARFPGHQSVFMYTGPDPRCDKKKKRCQENFHNLSTPGLQSG